MNAKLRILLLAAVALSTSVVSAQRLYRWVDENGNVHFGDRVPPEYADRDRAVLNEQGVAIDREEGARTPAEVEAAEREAEAEAVARAARAETARRDRMLLETYLSTADIENLRDSRLDLLQSQISVTENYLDNLKRRLASLRSDASRYKPYNEREDAPALPADLASEIRVTEASIASYEQTIQRTRDEQEKLRSQFDSDIERFKELKGG